MLKTTNEVFENVNNFIKKFLDEKINNLKLVLSDVQENDYNLVYINMVQLNLIILG